MNAPEETYSLTDLRDWAEGLVDNDAGWEGHGDTLRRAGEKLLALLDVVEPARDHLQESSAGSDNAATTANRLAEALKRFTP